MIAAERKTVADRVFEISCEHCIELTPKVFEILYLSEVGKFPELAKKIHNVKRNPSLNIAEEMLQLVNNSAAPIRRIDELEDIEARLEEQIAKVSLDLKRGIKGGNGFSTDVRDAIKCIAETSSRCEIRATGNTLVKTSREFLSEIHFVLDELSKSEDKISQLSAELALTKEVAMKDHLTGVFNRRFLDEQMQKLVDGDLSFVLCIIDVDRFKAVNDNWGHSVGDNVLIGLGNHLKKFVKNDDFVARMGGEEFAVVYRNKTLSDVVEIIESARLAFGGILWKSKELDSNIGRITFSAGVTKSFPGEGVEAHYQKADKKLYRAKSNGRNCIVA